ncbi:MAG TPA: energy transducer TonB [Allosphingosinicella sp.]
MQWTREKVGSALGVAVLHAALAYAFLTAIGAAPRLAPPAPALKLFDISEPPPPPPSQPAARKAAREPEGRAAPPGLKAEASPVVALQRPFPLPVPVPVTAASTPGEGASASQGAADVPGPGTGAGGAGAGTGSGGAGSGMGGGGGIATRARQIAGRIVNADYPRAASRARAEGEVLVRFTVEPSGRVGACTVLRSSGNEDLDSTTCRLIRQRYRFEPARDKAGRPTADEKAWVQRWWLERGE